MSDLAKINLKIGQLELSIEGPPDFVAKQYDKVEEHLKTYSELSSKIPDPKLTDSADGARKKTEPEGNTGNELSKTFGEWLNIIPKETSDTDKAILAGYYTQINSEQKHFRVRDVNKLLKEHSIKLSNPSQFIKGSVDAKKLFQHSKTGNEANYKLTRETEEEVIKSLSRK